mgnify:CR=1 FL=1
MAHVLAGSEDSYSHLLYLFIMLSLSLSLSSGTTPPPATAFSYSNFTSTAGLQLSIAEVVSVGGRHVVALPDIALSGAGSVFTTNHVQLNGFVTSFKLNFTSLEGIPAQDGVAFVVNASPKQYAGAGAGIGYAATEPAGTTGIPLSLAVEFDIFSDADMNDPLLPHISVHSLGGEPNSAREAAPAVLCAPATALPSFFNPDGVEIRIEYSSPLAWAPPGLDSQFTAYGGN